MHYSSCFRVRSTHDATAAAAQVAFIAAGDDDDRSRLMLCCCRLSQSSVGGQVLLPLNTYSVVQTGDAGSLLLEAGALKADGTRAVSTRCFQDEKCKSIALGIEQRS